MIALQGLMSKRRRTVGPSLSAITDHDDGYLANDCEWHPDGDFIAVAHNSGGNDELSVYSWDGSSLSQVETVNIGAHNREVRWHPNGDYLAVTSQVANKQLMVYSWNGTDTLAEVEAVNIGSDGEAISWNPDGDYLAFGTAASTQLKIYSWNGSDTLAQVATQSTSPNAIYGLDWNAAGTVLAAASGNGPRMYSWTVGTETIAAIDNVDIGAWCGWIAWSSADESYIVFGTSVATKNLIVYDWDGSNLTEVETIGHGAGFRATCSFDSTGVYLFSGKYTIGAHASSKYIYAYTWDSTAETLTEISSLTWDGLGILEVEINPMDDSYLVSSVNRDATYAKTLRVDRTGL